MYKCVFIFVWVYFMNVLYLCMCVPVFFKNEYVSTLPCSAGVLAGPRLHDRHNLRGSLWSNLKRLFWLLAIWPYSALCLLFVLCVETFCIHVCQRTLQCKNNLLQRCRKHLLTIKCMHHMKLVSAGNVADTQSKSLVCVHRTRQRF